MYIWTIFQRNKKLKKFLTDLLKILFAKMGLQLSRLNNKQAPAISAIEYNQKESLQRIYADKEKIKSYLNKTRLDFYREIIGLCSKYDLLHAEAHVLDAGFGTGQLLKYLSETYPSARISGFEYVETAMELGQETLPGADLFQWDIYHPLPKKYDLILNTEVLEHLEYPAKALSNLISALNGNGTVLVTVPEGRKDHSYGHIHFWSPESWNLFIREHYSECNIKTGTLMNGAFNYAIIRKNPVSGGR